MSIAGIPTNFLVQQANGQVLASWNLVAGATSYTLQRSTDGVTYTTIATPSQTQYLDVAVVIGTQYYYQVASTNGSGTSPYTPPQAIVPAGFGEMTLGQIRLLAQQRADRVNSQFVTTSEWNVYINQSYFELYDLLIDTYEDYYVATPYVFTTDGTTFQYPLPNGVTTRDAISNLVVAPFYKLMGVDIGLSGTSNAWVTLKKFEFIARNRFVFPQVTSTFLGVFNLRYRLVGNTIYFIPTPSAGQFIRTWYFPKLTTLLQDTDRLDGISGWTEYVVVDAARKALLKEESDTSMLMAEKQALIKRIEESAMNRDAGQPDTVSDTRSATGFWGGYGSPGGDGPYGGY